MLKKDTHSLFKKEVKDKINTAKNCYVYCVLDGVDVGHYFKTIKSDINYWTNSYFKDNQNLDSISKTFDLREDGDLYIN